MTGWPWLVVSGAAGGALGLAFFGGLWMTLAGLDRSTRPAVRLLGSLLIRGSLILGGFYVVARVGGWPHVLAALVGFTIARVVAVRMAPGQEARSRR